MAHITEDRLQQTCFNAFWNKYPDLRKLLFSVPNGGARTAREGLLLKQTGLVAGVSDLLFIYDARVFCFELKTEIGEQSKLQKEWQAKVEAQDVDYYIIRSEKVFMDRMQCIIGR